jgi:hypothetical protein
MVVPTAGISTARMVAPKWLFRAAASLALFAVSGGSMRGGSGTAVSGKLATRSGARPASFISSPVEILPAPPGTLPSSAVPPKQPDPQSGILAPLGVILDQSSDINTKFGDRESRILIPPGLTLYEICAEAFKTCHSRELDEIRRLNPWLTNPDHRESGRELRIPSAKELASVAEPPSHVTKPLEVAKQ